MLVGGQVTLMLAPPRPPQLYQQYFITYGTVAQGTYYEVQQGNKKARLRFTGKTRKLKRRFTELVRKAPFFSNKKCSTDAFYARCRSTF